MQYEKTDFLPEELKNPQIKSREGKKYRYLWLLSREPMSHGCTHVNGGHILELRQLLPADSKHIYNVEPLSYCEYMSKLNLFCFLEVNFCDLTSCLLEKCSWLEKHNIRSIICPC